MYLVFRCMPGEGYGRQRGSLLLRLYATFFERQLTPLLVDSAHALWASFCFRLFKLKFNSGARGENAFNTDSCNFN